MIRLPEALEADFRQELYAYEEQQRMPYVTTVEQAGIDKEHHDSGYKELFSHPEFVQQLIEGFAPAHPILPIVLYNGLERWQAAEDIDALVRPTPPLAPRFACCYP
nr:hypothetical protein [Halochromatium salexigens]